MCGWQMMAGNLGVLASEAGEGIPRGPEGWQRALGHAAVTFHASTDPRTRCVHLLSLPFTDAVGDAAELLCKVTCVRGLHLSLPEIARATRMDIDWQAEFRGRIRGERR